MKNIDRIEPKYYISEDNKNIIKQIEEKLYLINFDESI